MNQETAYQSYKGTPRLYVDQTAIASGMVITLDDDQTHYLKTVLRLRDGEMVRIFDGRSGEFVAAWAMTGKKQSELRVAELLRTQTQPKGTVHLFFPLIKKDRQDWLIEKAVELGVTDLHPVVTDHAVVREIKADRVARQIIEAAEQSERLTIPQLHPVVSFKDIVNAPMKLDLFVALERADGTPMLRAALQQNGNNQPHHARGFLCGPEGGFSKTEADMLQSLSAKHAGDLRLHLVSLGDTILRAETAALYGALELTTSVS